MNNTRQLFAGARISHGPFLAQTVSRTFRVVDVCPTKMTPARAGASVRMSAAKAQPGRSLIIPKTYHVLALCEGTTQLDPLLSAGFGA